MRVLLAEDDVFLGGALRSGLDLCGFQVDWVQDGFAALREAQQTDYAALVLDINMPRSDGLSVLQQLRSCKKQTPVLMLTANDADETITRSLDSGADDYVVKPVDIQVLAARLRALIRRSTGQASNALQSGALHLDPSTREAQLAGEVLQLSAREFDILHALLLASGRLLTREALEQHTYAWGHEVSSNAIEVHIHNLRKKLGKHKNYIVTVRGIGYKMPLQDLPNNT